MHRSRRQKSERHLQKILQMEEKDQAIEKKRQEKAAAELKQMLAAEEQVTAAQTGSNAAVAGVAAAEPLTRP